MVVHRVACGTVDEQPHKHTTDDATMTKGKQIRKSNGCDVHPKIDPEQVTRNMFVRVIAGVHIVCKARVYGACQ